MHLDGKAEVSLQTLCESVDAAGYLRAVACGSAIGIWLPHSTDTKWQLGGSMMEVNII